MNSEREETIVTALLDLLKHPDPQVKIDVLKLLVRIGWGV